MSPRIGNSAAPLGAANFHVAYSTTHSRSRKLHQTEHNPQFACKIRAFLHTRRRTFPARRLRSRIPRVPESLSSLVPPVPCPL